MRFFTRAILSAAMATGFSTSTLAQSEQDFIDAFAGQWFVFDPAMRSDGDACELNLSAEKEGDLLPVTTRGCTPLLSSADYWVIRDGRIVLSSSNAELAVLGGNQFRVTGEINETENSLVIERAQGDGSSARIATALTRYKCYFVGFTQQCAVREDMKIPTIDTQSGVGSIETLATLNARSQPRRDAPSLGNIAEGTTVLVNQCIVASDGTWCRASIGDDRVWLAMTALRQEKWPILTFRGVNTSMDN